MALSGARLLPNDSGGNPVLSKGYIGLAANAKVWQGAILVFDPASGFGTQGKTATGLIALGIAEAPEMAMVVAGQPPAVFSDLYDNTGGTGGGITCQYRQGVFSFLNSAAGVDLIAASNIGSDAYIVDDQTVALTDGNGTRSRLGKIVNLDTNGAVQVQVGISFALGSASPQSMVSMPIDFPTLANAGAYAVTPGFAGRIAGISVLVRKPATTAAKAATLTAQVAGANITTGGVVALTSANATPAGANVAGTAPTVGNAFTAAQSIGFGVSGVTAFVEGDGSVVLFLR